MDDVFWIDDEETMSALVDPTRVEIIEILQKPHTVKEVAETMDVPRTRLYHHVGLLEDCGAIQVVETRPSGAMVERVYQAAAHSFQLSKRFLESADPYTQTAAVLDSLFAITRADALAAVDLIGTTGLRDFSRRVVYLSPEEAKDLDGRMAALIEEFAGRRPDGGEPYALLTVFHRSSRRIR